MLSHDTQGRAICVRQVMPVSNAQNRGYLTGAPRERRRGFFCRYPHRPSDSVFIGGAGYLIKDDVRRRHGCL